VLDTEVQDGQLRRFVVRIDEAGNNVTRGSGVLVAPGWVLSCAHVVEGLDRVSVVPDRGAAAEGDAPLAVTGWVRARSEARPEVSETAFWPFPDLAVIELEDWSDHLFAPLVMAEPQRKGESHAWGFGRREAGVAAVGSPASFVYVGQEGDGFLSLKAGDAPPGLSGAPLVCPAQRGVVGVMSVSRNPSDARGGWASPATALTGDQGAPGELADLGTRMVAHNQREAWRHRDRWNRVLPVTGADRTVNMPWEGLAGARLPAPSVMLRAEFCLVHYLFREADLNAAVSWCRSQSPVEISYIDAQGGAGKTRFAIELCQQMRRRGWVAGMLPRQDHGISEIPQPRLVAVDYVEERDSAALAEQISALASSATEMTPVRILLLSRPTRGQRPGARMDVLREQEAASGAVIVALDDAEDRSAAVPSLTVPERGILFDSALLAFGRRWHGAEWTPQASGRVDLSADRYDRPLDVLLEAFDAALSGRESQSGGRPPVERALDHEERHWRPTRLLGFDALVLRRCAALATLAGARDEQEAAALLRLVPELAGESAAAARERMDRWLGGLYDGPDRWNPLRPDRLAEALVTRAVQQDGDDGRGLLAAVLALRSDRQVERALDVLARLADDMAMAPAIAAALTERHSALVDRCARQVRGTSQRPGRIGLLEGLARLHTAVLTDQRVADLPISVQSPLRASADTFGDLARDHGLIGEATGLYRQGLAITKRLAELEPDDTGFQRDLSISYDRLADLAQRAGHADEATGLYRQGLDISQRLTELEPDNADFQRDLSLFYARLAYLAHRAGHIDKATDLYQQGLDISQRMFEVEPDNTGFRRDLSISYGRLADLARDHGAPGKAAGLYRRGLAIAERLAELEPGNTIFQRDLPVFYDRLADHAHRAGHADEAARLYRKGLAIAERLFEVEPDNTGFQRDLPVSYDRLADLARDSGATDEASQLYQLALALRERLAELDPDNVGFQRDLSISYDRLADLARDSGATDEASRLYQLALALRERVVALKPDDTGFQRDLPVSYDRLADLARDSGATDEASRLYRMGLAIRKRLAALKPDDTDFQRDLSISYDRLADLAQRAGHTDKATRLYRKGLAIAERLARLDPDNAVFQRDLSLSADRLADLADLAVARADRADVARKYRHAFDLCERLFRAD